MRVVFLVDGHRQTVGGVGDLRDRVDDQTVVLLAIIRGDDVKPVADVEQRAHVVLVCGFVALCEVLAAQLVSHSGELLAALGIECGKDLDRGVGVGDVLALFQHTSHDLGCHGCPAAVFDQRNRAILKIALGQMVDELAHEGEDVSVVGGGCQHQLAVTEGVRHSLCHVASGKVVQYNRGCAVGAQLFCQRKRRLARVAVHRGVGDHNAVGLGLVARPGVVKVEVIAEVFGKNGAVQGADDLDVKACGLL